MNVNCRFSLQEDDLLEWDSYSPPFGNAADDDDDDDDDSSNDYGRRRRGLRRGLSSSSSCGVLSDLNHWMLSPSPRIFYDESPFPYSFVSLHSVKKSGLGNVGNRMIMVVIIIISPWYHNITVLSSYRLLNVSADSLIRLISPITTFIKILSRTLCDRGG